MLQSESIRAIVDEFVEKFKKSSTETKGKQFIKSFDLPEYWIGYRQAVAQMEAISLHFSNPAFPLDDPLVRRLFDVKSPNQTDEEQRYMIANFKAITAPTAIDYVSTTTRPLSDSNWSLEFRGDNAEKAKLYIDEDLPVFGSMEYFAQSILPTLKAKDANGVIVVMPESIPLVLDSDGNVVKDEQGDATISDELIEPFPHYFSSRDIVGQDFRSYILLRSSEKSNVEYNGKMARDGVVLFLIDDTNIYKIYQVGKKIDFQFSEPIIFHPHELGELPVTKLLGIPSIELGVPYYSSPFYFAVPLLDIALLDNATLQLSKGKCVFPYMIALGTECMFTRGDHSCHGGKIYDELRSIDTTCPNCNGSGLVSRVSAGGQLLINPDANFSNEKMNGDYIKYVSPDITTLEFLTQRIDGNIHKAAKMMHIPDSDESVTGNEGATATGSLSKARATQAFLSPIANQIYYIWDRIIYFTLAMRYGKDKVDYNLTHLSRYDVMTPDDYLISIGEAIKLNLPPMVIQSLVHQYISTMFFTDSQSQAAYTLLMETDMLLTMLPEDIAMRLGNGNIEPYQDVIHNSGLQIVDSLLRENDNFFEQEFTIQQEQLIQKAKDMGAKVSTQTPAEALRASLQIA